MGREEDKHKCRKVLGLGLYGNLIEVGEQQCICRSLLTLATAIPRLMRTEV